MRQPAAGPRRRVTRRLAALSLAVAAAAPSLAALPVDAVSAASAWQLTLHSDRHSDALRLGAFDHDAWDELSPRRGRNLVYLDDGLRLARREGAWTWSLVAQSSATLVASNGALRLAADIATGRRPPADRSDDVALRLRGYSGAGLALGRDHPLAKGWHARWEVQALQLSRWIERRFEGPVQYQAAGARYGFALRSQEIDNRLDFPFQQPFAPRGAGLLVSAGVSWQGSRAWASADVREAGWLHWRGVPQQQAVLDTSTQTVDSDGFLVFRPLVEGRNAQADLTRSPPWRASLAGGLTLRDGQVLGLHGSYLPGFGWLPEFRWQRPAASPDGLALGLRWQLHERRLGVTLGWRGLTLHAAADRLGAGARSQAWSVGYVGGF